ncbi:hypothetical protein NHP190012_04690 [Helicobacter sp. NHP19-012]|uniref:Septum formation initiator n=1 Tax=Helicobacter gastrofelis TaxID=2849642 RepID=A0ABN6I5H3_9HELI|nr:MULTISPECIES: hypothetical protein [unclassified Helicobacter]BCZ18827.1 hypothetical protein NHP190012_04690 [Helicobacter sp. NHP19-012]GMB96238.1 hypothetical protein NHP22001_08270 [Helicobacter sp. NHP22-001]
MWQVWQWLYAYRGLFIVFGLVVALGVYVGCLFFGDNSLEVLMGLKRKQVTLYEKVQNLQYENAKLQKKLFELKELEPPKNRRF